MYFSTVTRSDYRLFIGRLEASSFALFSSRFIFLGYTDSSNQREFFLGSLALRICPIESVKYARLQKTSEQMQIFFQCSFLFLRGSVSSLLHKESMF